MKAYISSTFSDLRPYREAAFDQIRRMGIAAIGMEYFGASTALPVEESLSAVRGADIYILIIGHRYGFVPEGYDKSITHLEYETAIKVGIPVLVFVLSNEVPITVFSIESDERRRSQLEAFKNELFHKHVVAQVHSPDNFAVLLANSLYRILAKSRTKVTASSLNKQLSVCREETEKYKKVIDDLSAKLRRIVPADPIWRGRNFQTDELLCFALLPFKDDFFEVYETAIAPAAETNGLRAMHAGEIFGNREIVEDIWDSICSARIVVADVTGRNPNVFYELGICHTLGKECVVITQNKEDVPFDIRHRRFIEYNTKKLASLRTTLGKTVQAVLTVNAKPDK